MKRLIDPVILCARARAFPDPRVGSCEFPRFPRNIRETRSSDQIESRSKGRRCQKKVVDACRRIENYWPRYVSGFYQSLPLHRARSCSLSLSLSLVLWETNFSAAFCQNARTERMISRGDLQSKSAYGPIVSRASAGLSNVSYLSGMRARSSSRGVIYISRAETLLSGMARRNARSPAVEQRSQSALPSAHADV